MDEWILEQRNLAGRLPRRYASIEDAFRRMQEENPHLSSEQARHLTVHGVNQNEDGTYSWKVDNYVRAFPPYDMSGRDIRLLWSRIACPTLLLVGKHDGLRPPAVVEPLAKLIPGARFEPVDSAHFMAAQTPELVAGIMNRFLAEHGC